MTDTPQSFRNAFLAGDPLIGCFLKIANTQPAEILGSAGYDFVVVDEEHAPFSRESTDRIILACKAYGIASLVRVQSPSPEAILSVLDCGADGVLVPHVDSAEKARAVVAAAREELGVHRVPRERGDVLLVRLEEAELVAELPHVEELDELVARAGEEVAAVRVELELRDRVLVRVEHRHLRTNVAE